MGQIVAMPLCSVFWGNKELNILLMGLENAGKTTLLYMLKEGVKVETIPSVSFNVESIQCGNVKFTVWDIPGMASYRPGFSTLRYYCTGAHGLIFVVDSDVSKGDRVSEARDELQRVMSEPELDSNVKVLVFVNKQDQPQALSVAKVTEKLGLATMLQQGQWLVRGCCATTGEGLHEGLNWLATTLRDT